MIVFRRLATDLREIRWGHVLVELLLVIAGILIALWVNNWMEARRDARAERQYLELLDRDLARDLEVVAEFKAFEDLQVRDAVAAYRAIARSEVPQDAEAVARQLAHLVTRRTLRLTRSTFNDLISTGNIRLIRNRDLRDQIVRQYESSDRAATVIDRNNQHYVDEAYSQYLLATSLVAMRSDSNYPPFDAALDEYEARVGVPVTVANDRLWRLPKDAPEWDVLRAKLRMRGIISVQASRQATLIAEDVSNVRKAVAEELSRRRWPGGD